MPFNIFGKILHGYSLSGHSLPLHAGSPLEIGNPRLTTHDPQTISDASQEKECSGQLPLGVFQLSL